MLLILFHAFYMAILTLPLGWSLMRWLQLQGAKTTELPPLSLLMLLGWAMLTGVAAWFSLWIPVGHGGLQVALLLLSGWIWYREAALRRYLLQAFRWVRSWHWLPQLLLVAISLMLWHRAAMPGMEADEGLYYLPFIRWTQQFWIVPGLGNLHGRLAFNSHWHVLHALMDWQQASLLLDFNVYISGVVSAFALGRLNAWLKGSQDWLDILAGLFLWPTAIWLRGLTSPIADIPLIYLTWVMGWWTLSLSKQPVDQRRMYLPVLLALGMWSMTIKLSGGLLLLMPLWLMSQTWQMRWIWLGLWIGVGWLLPWLIRYYLLSGYWVYPVGITGFLHPDWQVPLDWVEGEVLGIKGWARLPGPQYQQAATGPISFWIAAWWSKVPWGIRLMLFIGPLSMVFAWTTSLWQWWRGRHQTLSRELLILQLILALMLWFWFSQAPAPRFGLGAISLAAFLPIAWGLHALHKWRGLPWVMGTICLVAQIPTFHSFGTASLLFPPPARHAQVIEVLVGEQPVWLAKDGECHDQPLPCGAYQKQIDRLEWRSETMRDGFRAKQP